MLLATLTHVTDSAAPLPENILVLDEVTIGEPAASEGVGVGDLGGMKPPATAHTNTQARTHAHTRAHTHGASASPHLYAFSAASFFSGMLFFLPSSHTLPSFLLSFPPLRRSRRRKSLSLLSPSSSSSGNSHEA